MQQSEKEIFFEALKNGKPIPKNLEFNWKYTPDEYEFLANTLTYNQMNDNSNMVKYIDLGELNEFAIRTNNFGILNYIIDSENPVNGRLMQKYEDEDYVMQILDNLFDGQQIDNIDQFIHFLENTNSQYLDKIEYNVLIYSIEYNNKQLFNSINLNVQKMMNNPLILEHMTAFARDEETIETYIDNLNEFWTLNQIYEAAEKNSNIPFMNFIFEYEGFILPKDSQNPIFSLENKTEQLNYLKYLFQDSIHNDNVVKDYMKFIFLINNNSMTEEFKYNIMKYIVSILGSSQDIEFLQLCQQYDFDKLLNYDMLRIIKQIKKKNSPEFDKFIIDRYEYQLFDYLVEAATTNKSDLYWNILNLVPNGFFLDLDRKINVRTINTLIGIPDLDVMKSILIQCNIETDFSTLETAIGRGRLEIVQFLFENELLPDITNEQIEKAIKISNNIKIKEYFQTLISENEFEYIYNQNDVIFTKDKAIVTINGEQYWAREDEQMNDLVIFIEGKNINLIQKTLKSMEKIYNTTNLSFINMDWRYSIISALGTQSNKYTSEEMNLMFQIINKYKMFNLMNEGSIDELFVENEKDASLEFKNNLFLQFQDFVLDEIIRNALDNEIGKIQLFLKFAPKNFTFNNTTPVITIQQLITTCDLEVLKLVLPLIKYNFDAPELYLTAVERNDQQILDYLEQNNYITRRSRQNIDNLKQQSQKLGEMEKEALINRGNMNSINYENIIYLLKNTDVNDITENNIDELINVIIKLSLNNNINRLKYLMEIIPEFLLDDRQIDSLNFIEIIDKSNYDIIELLIGIIPIEITKETIYPIIDKGDIRILQLILEYDYFQFDEDEVLEMFNYTIKQNSKNFAEEFANILNIDYDKELNKIKQQKQKLETKVKTKKLLEAAYNEDQELEATYNQELKYKIDADWLKNSSLQEQIELLKDTVQSLDYKNFVSEIKQLYKFHNIENLSYIYNEKLCLDLMMTIIKESVNYNYNDLFYILEECEAKGIDILNNKSLNKLYDETLLTQYSKIQEYMYSRYPEYFINRLIDDVIEQNEEDFDFLFSVIPKDILQDYKEYPIVQKTINRIFLSGNVDQIRQLYNILELTINDSTLLDAIEGGDVDVVKFLIEEASDFEYFADVMTEAIELSKQIDNPEITNYLKQKSNPQYAKTLNRLNKIFQHIKSRSEVNKFLNKKDNESNLNNNDYTSEFLQDQFEKSEFGQELGLSEQRSVGLPWEVEDTKLKPAIVSNFGIDSKQKVTNLNNNRNNIVNSNNSNIIRNNNLNSNNTNTINQPKIKITYTNEKNTNLTNNNIIKSSLQKSETPIIEKEEYIQPINYKRSMLYNNISTKKM